MNLSTFIANTKFFAGLSRTACDRLAEHTHMRRYDKGQVLFMQEQAGSMVFMLASGWVRLTRMGERGEESVVGLMGPGDVFGEVILFERNNYPVTATTLTPIEAALLQRYDLRQLLADESFRNQFVALLFAKQRTLVQRIQQLTQGDVKDRFLLFLESHYGDRQTIKMDLSKKEVASAIGVTPECFSRLLRRLRDEKNLRWHNGMIIRSPS